MRAATVLLPAPAGPSIATTSGEFWFSIMLLASYAVACAAESRPVTCRPVSHLAFHPAFRQTCLQVFHSVCRPAFHLVFRQTYPLVFHPACHSAGLRMSRDASTVSPVARRGQSAVSSSGCRRRWETKAWTG